MKKGFCRLSLNPHDRFFKEAFSRKEAGLHLTFLDNCLKYMYHL